MRVGVCVFVLAVAVALPMWKATPLSAQTAVSPVRKLYILECAKCHGVDGTPRKIAKDARPFTDPTWQPTLEEIEHVITVGKDEAMKPFRKKLTPQQIRNLAEYVLVLRKGTVAKN